MNEFIKRILVNKWFNYAILGLLLYGSYWVWDNFMIVKYSGNWYSPDMESSLRANKGSKTGVFLGLYSISSETDSLAGKRVYYAIAEYVYSHDGGLFSGFDIDSTKAQLFPIMTNRDRNKFHNAVYWDSVRVYEKVKMSHWGNPLWEFHPDSLPETFSIKYSTHADSHRTIHEMKFKQVLTKETFNLN